MHGSELDSFAIKDIITFGQIVSLKLRYRDVSAFISWFWWLYRAYVGEYSCLLEIQSIQLFGKLGKWFSSGSGKKFLVLSLQLLCKFEIVLKIEMHTQI